MTTSEGFELDIVMTKPGRPTMLVEIKSTTEADERHAKALVLAAKDFPEDTERYLVSRDPIARVENGITYLPWDTFLRREFASMLD